MEYGGAFPCRVSDFGSQKSWGGAQQVSEESNYTG